MSRNDVRVVSVLAIGGSDSGGASGIQADLKSLASLGVHGLSALTAITAQTTSTVRAIYRVPTAHLVTQMDAAAADYRIAAVKIGMLASSQNLLAVIAWLRARRLANVVLDPVFASSSGTALIPAAAVATLRDELMPRALLVTPNLDELDVLLGKVRRDPYHIREAGHALLDLGARAVLIKGGHADGKKVRDFLITTKSTQVFTHSRLPLMARGTGCALAAAIAAFLARGESLESAVSKAQRYVQKSLRKAYRPGHSDRHVLGHVDTPKR